MSGLIQDVRFALRVLANSPGTTIITVLALALGIGANTACFSSVYAMVLRPFPFADLDRIVRVWDTDPKIDATRNSVSKGDFMDWREQARAFLHLAAFDGTGVSLTGVADPEWLSGQLVSPDFFPLLGVETRLGRTFAGEEYRPGRDFTVVLSDGLWKRRFASDPSVVGRVLSLDGQPHVVTGVMPPDFDFPLGTDLWKPLVLSAEDRMSRRKRELKVIGRLRPGIAPDQAQAELSAIASELAARFPETNEGHGAYVRRLRDATKEQANRFVLIGLASAVFVLLLACANVANLQLARALSRERETAVRTALGAGRWRIARQFQIENLLLALAGGALGVFLAFWAVDLQRASLGEQVYRAVAGLRNLGVNGAVLAFSAGMAVLTGLLVGLVPAFASARRRALNEVLKESGRNAVGPARGRLRGALVVAEVALALVLLVSAALMARTFRNIANYDLGYNPRNLLTMRVGLPSSRYSEQTAGRFFDDAVERLRGLDGVSGAAAASLASIAGFRAEGQPAAAPGQALPDLQLVTPGYVETLGLPVLRGRAFIGQDAGQRPADVAVVSESVLRRYWKPGVDPIGSVVHIPGETFPPLTVVGVVGDVKDWFTGAPQPLVYVLSPQKPQHSMRLFVRTVSDPMGIAAAARAQLQSLDSRQLIFQLTTEEKLLAGQSSGVRASVGMMVVFAVIALVLAATGIYGVMSYTVARRTREIGIRMALGARMEDVLRSAVAESLRLSGIGVAIGLAASYGLMRAMSSALYGLVSLDISLFAGVAVILALAALPAGYIPARRAARVDPLVALRYE